MSFTTRIVVNGCTCDDDMALFQFPFYLSDFASNYFSASFFICFALFAFLLPLNGQ